MQKIKSEIPVGLCQCGCGQKTNVLQSRHAKEGIDKQYNQFVRGHYLREKRLKVSGENHPRWKGGRSISGNGYSRIHQPDHPNAHSNGYRLEHVVIAERAFGKPLPPGAVVHHVDGDPLNNRNDNLVVCPDQAYHLLLHMRLRALRECGNANYRKCKFCRQYTSPEHLIIQKQGKTVFHRQCQYEYNRKFTLRRKEQRDNGAAA